MGILNIMKSRGRAEHAAVCIADKLVKAMHRCRYHASADTSDTLLHLENTYSGQAYEIEALFASCENIYHIYRHSDFCVFLISTYLPIFATWTE